jgi:arsenite methyltransferase
MNLTVYKKSGSGIYSITIYADKLEVGSCCNTTENGCCGSETKTDSKTTDKPSCCGTTANTNGTSCC